MSVYPVPFFRTLKASHPPIVSINDENTTGLDKDEPEQKNKNI
jgi:hypothetical protein